MKLKKKTIMLISFSLGALLFAATAFADMVSKNGYEQLKDSIKLTAKMASEEYQSLTFSNSIEIKNNGELLLFSNEEVKYDRNKNARENTSSQGGVARGGYSYYSYYDNDVRIWQSGDDPVYYLTELRGEAPSNYLDNPFEQEWAEDVEKIIDALVGSLKDHVVVTDNPDGSKELSGSLSQIQIPALLNAISSLQLKQLFHDGQEGLPVLTQDIYIKEINGQAYINKDGILESIFGTAVFTGRDKQGQLHEMNIDILFKVSGINSTAVSKPDLTGKEVVRNVETVTKFGPELSNPQKFIGLYKNDILLEKDGQYQKIGERFVDVATIDQNTVTGRYYEVYKEEYKEYAQGIPEFSFEASFEAGGPRAMFVHPEQSARNRNGSIYFDEYHGKLYFELDWAQPGEPVYDSQFGKVFE